MSSMLSVQNKTDVAFSVIDVRVRYLDDHVEVFTINDYFETCGLLESAFGFDLYHKISMRMQLIESYFFGLQYLSVDSDLCWLDFRKAIKKQNDYKNEYDYEFCVKFYAPDPNLLHDHLTKKLFVLQLKKDLRNGELICSESTKILLGGLFLQLQYPESEDLQLEETERFLANLFNHNSFSQSFIDQCLKFLKTLKNQTVTETNSDILEIVRKIDFYGMKLHPAKDNEGLSLNLAVYHMGIVIFQKCKKINTFNWSKIRKISFKRKRFLIKLHLEEYLELFVLWVIQGFYKDTLEFYFESRNSCKNFWKKCIEHHTFFRTQSSSSHHSYSKSNKKFRFHSSFSGSRFRYVGLTQYELNQFHNDTHHLSHFLPRSESAARLTSPNTSLVHFFRNNSDNKCNSNHSLSVPIKPSNSDNSSVENKCSENSDHRKLSERSLWEQPSNFIKNMKNEFSSFENPSFKTSVIEGIENSDSLCSNEPESSSFFDNATKCVKYLPSASTSDETVPLSLIDVPDFSNDIENQHFINDENVCIPFFDEYAFVPNLLAQISISECSKSELSSNFLEKFSITNSTNFPDSNKISENFPSYKSDNLCLQVVLQCMEKEFLFNEFTHLRDTQMLIKIFIKYINNCEQFSETIKRLVHLLKPMEAATTTMINKLEKLIQLNIQFLTTSLDHIHRFFIIVEEYCRQIQDQIKSYVKDIKDFICSLIHSDFSKKVFNASQVENDPENQKNVLRLFLSPIIQQRAHLSCLSIFISCLPSEIDRLKCEEILSVIRDSLTGSEGIEEITHIGILKSLVKGLFHNERIEMNRIDKYHPIRIGWLQKLSNKGASNRLFILLPDQLICAKKVPSLSFSIEHRWSLSDIQVGTISDMTKISNGYEAPVSPFDSVTIMLWDARAKDPRYSTVVLLADTNKSRSLWIEEIRKTVGSCKNGSHNTPQDIASKTDLPSDSKCWTDKYRLADICWHDRMSISKLQMGFFFQFSLSAYLLRKYKSSNNWQRLWVVLTDCHLFFYQSHVNEPAITSLCLVGFQISEPNLKDSITKQWVIKLEKELKTCFLRTENQYFYHRWRSALSYSTFYNA